MDSTSSDERLWQKRLGPIFYDSLFHHHLHFPTQACRWGPKSLPIESDAYRTRYHVYFSEQVSAAHPDPASRSEPNKLIVANVDVFVPGVISSDNISKWQDKSKCPYIKDHKVILHPGEVNKIREIPQQPHLVVTHTDDQELYLWNVTTQGHRGRERASGGKGNAPNLPDLRLIGHEDLAVFPLATSLISPFIASGGNDKLVLIWSLEDAMETLLAGGGGGGGSKTGEKESKAFEKTPTLKNRTRLIGHTGDIQDVCFQPDSDTKLASVSVDKKLILWDTRSSKSAVTTVPDAHGTRKNDVQCVDWEGTEQGASPLIATGAEDGSVRVWDNRRLDGNKSFLASWTHHKGGIIRLEWNPLAKGVLASGGEDHLVNIWRMQGHAYDDPPVQYSSDAAPLKKRKDGSGPLHPSELLFMHGGHRKGKVVDFQWLRDEAMPWTMLSVGVNESAEEMDGQMQLWRINPLIHMDEEKAIESLSAHQDYILRGTGGGPEPRTKKIPITKLPKEQPFDEMQT